MTTTALAPIAAVPASFMICWVTQPRTGGHGRRTLTVRPDARGTDRFSGGSGDDRINARDRRGRDDARDVIDCGAGDDTALVDDDDIVVHCEHVERTGDDNGVDPAGDDKGVHAAGDDKGVDPAGDDKGAAAAGADDPAGHR